MLLLRHPPGLRSRVPPATGINIRTRATHNLSEKETNTWEAKVKVEDLAHDGKSNDDRILALIVTAEDENNNTGNSAGWSGGAMPAAGDKLDFKKLDAGGFLVEVDSLLRAGYHRRAPGHRPGGPRRRTRPRA